MNRRGDEFSTEYIYFLIEDFTKTEQNLDEGENINIEFVDFEDAKKMCLDGSIDEERSALALLRYLNGGFK